MSIAPYRQSVQDEIMTSALVRAAGNLLDDLVDRVLRNEERVATAAEGKLLIAADDGMEEVADRVQRFVAVATPTVRVLVRVLGSLLAFRLEQVNGAPADPALVKKLAVELYLAPKRKPDVARLDLPLAKLARRWLLRGVFGRDTRRAAEKALDAAEQLDLDHVLETRRTGN